MKKIGLLVIFIGFWMLFPTENLLRQWNEFSFSNFQQQEKRNPATETQSPPTSNRVETGVERPEEPDETGIYGVTLGQTKEEVLAVLDTPQRKDRGRGGVEWWIFNQPLERYVQVGFMNGRVVDLYSNAPTWSYKDIRVGTKRSELQQGMNVSSTVSFSYDGATFEAANDLQEKVLIIDIQQPVIFYLDRHEENRVTAVRIMSLKALVLSKMFPLQYRYQGEPPQVDPIDVSVSAARVEEGMEKQLLDLTNVIRQRNDLSPVSWDGEGAAVAKSHSQDMRQNDYFQHTSPSTGMGPMDRLQQSGISYTLAGENIAKGQWDAIEAHEAWMNSAGHRKNILHSPFERLGVGVVGKVYTQNFFTRP